MFHQILQQKIKRFLQEVYSALKNFPPQERYSMTDQLRRATLSVSLNYAEGNASRRAGVLRRHIEIAYGSLKEVRQLFEVAAMEGYLTEVAYADLSAQADELGAMLWGILKRCQ